MENDIPKSRSSLDISNNIDGYIGNELLDCFSNLIALECDGTIVNTGVFNWMKPIRMRKASTCFF